MKDINDDAPESNGSCGFIRATLAIPEHAVRVISALPETITQRNVEAVTGLPARTFLELIRSPGFPLRVRHIGKLRVVNRSAFVQWLEVGGPKRDIAEVFVPDANECANEQPVRANELLASVGFESVRQRVDRVVSDNRGGEPCRGD